ncbi:MAG: MFS transporter [Clostridia bacterium]|nr:MFS transporter [Clostridia bacterium]
MTSKKFGKLNWTILLVFGLIGQIAWSVENMYFNLFVYDTVAKDLDAVTLMVQLSGITATVATLIAGTLSDRVGNRKKFLCFGYAIWGITVALFGALSPRLMQSLFGVEEGKAITITLVAVVVGDCVMTLFGSTANDAAFNAWVTDNTHSHYRGAVEGILSILPLVAMLVVAGGFGILVEAIGYKTLFLILGIVISLCGILGFFFVQDNPALTKSGSFKDIFYGFRPSVVKKHKPLYLTLVLVLIYGVACQIFMPYLIIYMKETLGFSVLEYSVVFALAILLGAGVNVYLTRLSDGKDKLVMLYFAAAVMAAGLLGMYFAKGMEKLPTLILFGVAGFVMITGYVLVSALCGSTVRDYTPEGAVGKLQGVRMVFSVLVPMVLGPMIGNAINRAANIPLSDPSSADAMTTLYVPAPEIFLFGAIVTLLMIAVIPILQKAAKKEKRNEIENEV